MLVLGLETSTPVCSVALSDAEHILAEYTLELGIHHSERLLPMVQRILDDAAVSLPDLSGIAIASGPGSFTGLRIGMSTAKGLCMALDISLLAVPTLQALAFSVLSNGMAVCAMLDARREEVYGGVYRLEAGVPVVFVEDQAGCVTSFLSELPRPVWFTGDGARAYRKQIVEAMGADAHFVPNAMGRPQAGSVAQLGIRLLNRGDVSDPGVVEPTYLRRSQAEQVREARLKSVIP
ncbi:MAG: tRNA (adenosine(37)-N6)-threonylcarbamoyltransferase complex dimerization subunit type 1 TsaB [bacterium]|nr:tRNA (adenosine(37)-N6)-threonylcarbamoyltransferase complex dimerization subunit type 1 TsaB [bacterium]